ncbi:hypothetical protein ACFWBX_09730 [Streptomyces sp. NPDC059991]|uniref:hypothetical protein n=1 Tax=Streptomyces sp. NPDC059991 TaxID=3347028 RepID=UPI0036C9D365
MTSDTIRTTGPRDDVAELVATIEAGGFWRLAPKWVPRGGYTPPNHDVLMAALAGLRRKL